MNVLMMIVASFMIYAVFKAISEAFTSGWVGGAICASVVRLIDWSMS